VDRAGFSTPPWPSRRPRPAPPGRAADRPPTARSGSTSPNAPGATEFTGYTATSGEAQVVALVKDGKEVAIAPAAGDSVSVVVNQTPFYGESGGQTGDAGIDHRADGLKLTVSDTAKPLGRLHAHHAQVEAGTIKVGDTVSSTSMSRAAMPSAPIIRPRTCSTRHCANRLGAHVTQKGSLVAADRLRFDFSHPAALTHEDIAAIEAEVNAQIRANEPVTTRLMTPDDAIEAGAMALFGEKYGDEVRVLSMGRAQERQILFGRTVRRHPCARHRRHRPAADRQSKARSARRAPDRGIDRRRRAPVAGRPRGCAEGAASLLKTTPDDVEARVAALLDERRKLERELAEAKKALALWAAAGGAAPAAGRGSAA
jgi:alanyl-tRNA synthetase